MKTKLSRNGRVVIPQTIRRKLGLRGGDELTVELNGRTICLSPHRAVAFEPRIVIDEISGLPVLDLGEDAPVRTSEQVRAALLDFP